MVGSGVAYSDVERQLKDFLRATGDNREAIARRLLEEEHLDTEMVLKLPYLIRKETHEPTLLHLLRLLGKHQDEVLNEQPYFEDQLYDLSEWYSLRTEDP